MATQAQNCANLRKITYEIINLFMQNEPNLQNDKMNVSLSMTKDYQNIHPLGHPKNEPKTNPIC